MRRVRCAGGKIGKEGTIRRYRLLLMNPSDTFVRQIARELISFFRPFGRLDRIGVTDQRRIKLISLAGNKAVEVIEALISRPIVEWSSRTGLVVRHVVVLAKPSAGVSVLLEQFGECRAAFRDDAAIAGVAGSHFLDDPCRTRMMVAARQHCRARRRT